MWRIQMNPELGSIKEKLFMGLELWQIGHLLLALAMSLSAVILLPDLGAFKGVLSAIPALPFVLISMRPIWGLKGLQLATAIVRCVLNKREITYRSEAWREVNKHC